VAPVIPGLTDHEIPSILETAAEAGASFAGMIVLRLPHGVKEIFSSWLEQHVPERARRVLNRVRELHGGRLYDARFGRRGRGQGPWATQLGDLFRVHARRARLCRPPTLSVGSFRSAPESASTQIDLFGRPAR